MPITDIAQDIFRHKRLVNNLCIKAAQVLLRRGADHDASKLSDIELPVYEEVLPEIQQTTFGTPEYFTAIQKLGVALQHHYQVNAHHPEHYRHGVNDMTLFDLLEWLIDMIAVVQTKSDGDIRQSLLIQQERYSIGVQLFKIISNTVDTFDMLE